ncbi:hypothetical protein METBIDRAFT_9566 [Metschnikowia bicuspidata var. bicuspidata NRRL YB-4993]|uniref:Uncharacterized protein n=1 Tax=Metschnikowia bicuspidata var. bicuspidata NRRL YB-4993 TaxID=869754 RepID=A0A1A0HH13_9ASCO|nr:hypothetical protein METBIDRAFT_9566 [Metschnikowia bicuspidata var. bicuspidata NRRL YB-4993]OBA23286.1 hypothetical protein METBIDRAFT_9566 [Metschnikowia bicuspidata var. bicuspidata NRRL YB-4993]
MTFGITWRKCALSCAGIGWAESINLGVLSLISPRNNRSTPRQESSRDRNLHETGIITKQESSRNRNYPRNRYLHEQKKPTQQKIRRPRKSQATPTFGPATCPPAFLPKKSLPRFLPPKWRVRAAPWLSPRAACYMPALCPDYSGFVKRFSAWA